MEATKSKELKKSGSKYLMVLLLGSLWNIVFGSIGTFNLPLHKELFYYSVSPITHVTANQYFWLAVLIAGIGYGIVAIVHHKYRFQRWTCNKLLAFLWRR